MSMIATQPRIGSLLASVLEATNSRAGEFVASASAAVLSVVHHPPPDELRVVVKLASLRAGQGEPWRHYKERVTDYLRHNEKQMKNIAGVDHAEPIFSANAFQAVVTPIYRRFEHVGPASTAGMYA